MSQSQETKDQIHAISDAWEQAAKLLNADDVTLDSLIDIQREFQKMASLLAVQIGVRQVEKMDTMQLMMLIASKGHSDDGTLDVYGDDGDPFAGDEDEDEESQE